MEAIPTVIAHAALSARDRLSDLSRLAATADAAPGSSAAAGSMAKAAREAIFVDALTAAMHSRLEELKSVARP